MKQGGTILMSAANKPAQMLSKDRYVQFF